ncbi:hypothetical protein BDQ17DRAFT_1436022 [Cyathus striatus]|nr:hypothetical protein BDQ17DRAFT_1436022 [Cyathus striatus]
MPPRRSARNQSTKDNVDKTNARKHTISSTDPTTQPAKKKGRKGGNVDEGQGGNDTQGNDTQGNDTQKKKGKKGKGRKSAMQRIAKDSQAAPPVKLTNAEQNIIDNGTSVAPPKRIRDATISLVPATQTLSATSGHIHRSEILETESTESESTETDNNNENTTTGNAGNDSSNSESGEEDTANQSKVNTPNKSSDNSSNNDSDNEFEEEDTVNQSKEDNYNHSNEITLNKDREDNSPKNNSDNEFEDTVNQSKEDNYIGESIHPEVDQLAGGRKGDSVDIHMMSPPRKEAISKKNSENSETQISIESKGDHAGDIHMESPPKKELYNLQESSRVTGGFMRHRAQGNVHNVADFEEIEKESTYLEHVKGIVYLYISNLDPTMFLCHPITESEQWFFIVDNDSPHWRLLGSYECSIEDNEDFIWIQTENYVLHVLCSSFHPSAQQGSLAVTGPSRSTSLSTSCRSVSMAPSVVTELNAESQTITARLGVVQMRLMHL